MSESRLLVVGRLRKPHGLKGEVAVYPLTDQPAGIFTPGRVVTLQDLGGNPLGEPVTIERARPFHREWLLKFKGLDDRNSLEAMRDTLLSLPAEELKAPEGDEVYLHELAGFSVRDLNDKALGVVTGLYEMPGGLMLEVQGVKREFLLPYKKEFVRSVNREDRRLVVQVPDGLLDL